MLPRDCIASSALVATLVALASGLAGCGDDTEPAPLPPSTTVPVQPASPTGHVRFKGDRVLANDLSRDLALEPSAICNELGSHPCTTEVHKITLGGVDPYDRQIYVSSKTTVSTTPLAADRVVLSACLERARRDFEGATETTVDTGVLFGGLPLDGQNLADAHGTAAQAVIERLYVALLARHATAGEIAALVDSYAAIEASGDATPAKTWSALSCFAVGTSVEFLFY